MVAEVHVDPRVVHRRARDGRVRSTGGLASVVKPSVGRIVHYVSFGTPIREDGTQVYTSECRAAVITQVLPLDEMDTAQAEIEQWDESATCIVGVAVLNPTGMFFHPSLPYDPNRAGGTWHWPERVDE